MTASTFTSAPSASRSRVGAVATIAIAIVVGAAVLGLIVGAVTFAALAIAFPLALPIAERFGTVVSPGDMAIAEQLGRLWWVFGAIAVASFAAAVGLVVKTIAHLSRASTD